ncbi:MAG: beta-phosphoglucomutase [Firmicutes bacterium]|nr:beta-phosphoglucomutase [Candidatus Colivicinus equi]
MIKAVIFDLDGVICSTDKYHYQAWKQLADELGVFFNKEINNRLKGVSRMESLDILLEKSEKKYSLEEKQELAKKKNDIYRNLLKNMDVNSVSSDVLKTLYILKRKGIKVAIGSSSKNTMYILERIGLDNCFDAIADGTQITKSKPDPEVFLLAAKKLNFEPNDCVVVEDAKTGIDAANSGRFVSIGINDAADYCETKYRIKKVSDILNIINEL